MKMKKYLLTVLSLSTMIMTLIACGSDNATSDTDVKNPITDQTQVEVPVEPDTSVDIDTDTDVEIALNTDTEAGKEDTPDENSEIFDENVAMVDWETWATQADNDEVCMVVWNEQTRTQKILQSIGEKDVNSYIVQEGDKFSVPKRNNIDFITIEYANKDSSTDLFWSSTEKPYWEFELPVDEMMYVFIIRNDVNMGVTYCFNY